MINIITETENEPCRQGNSSSIPAGFYCQISSINKDMSRVLSKQSRSCVFGSNTLGS